MATASQPERSHSRSPASQKKSIKYEKLSLALLNINGLRNKTHEIRHIIAHDKLHVVALCETKLNSTVKESDVYIPGFTMWRRDRNDNSDNKGGGVALYVQDHIKTTLRPDLMKAEADKKNHKAIIWVEMKLPDSRPVLLGCCYRRPDNLKHLVQIYETMNLVLQEEKDILLMGDFNTDWDLDPEKNVAKYVSSKSGLNQIVQHKTRITQKSSSCIDLIYTNIPVDSGIKPESTATGCSDHNLVTVKLSRNVPQKIISSRLKLVGETLWKIIVKTQWTDVYDESDPPEALKKFTDIFLSVANRHLKNQDIYGLLKLDDKMEKLIYERDKSKHLKQEELKKKHAEKAAEPDKCDDDSAKGSGVKCFQCKAKSKLKPKCEYNICKGLTQHCETIKKKEREQFMQQRKEAVNSSEILKICKEYFGESLPSHVINITQDGNVTSDLYYLREEEIFGDLLVETMTNEADQLVFGPNQTLNECLVCLLSTDMKDADIPEIDVKLLNLSAGSISGPIRHILNLCLENHVFPSELKQFELIPFSTNKLTKFRENMSLHSVHIMIGFIFDTILYKQAEKYFIDRKLIASESIDDQIKNLKTNWLKATESGETVSVLFLDFSSSFDSISHDVLITKLKESGFSDSALKLIESFLSYHEGSCGLPRGSFFARLLFTVFINKLNTYLGPSSAVICQNHMIVYTKDKVPETSKKQLEAKKQSVTECAKNHIIHMNKSTDFTITRDSNITSDFKLLQSLLDCNQFNVNWVQVLRKLMESCSPSGQEKFKKTFKTYEKSFGGKECCKASEDDINSALISLVLL
ncbi:uncharacterized protein LOC116733898 isoform X5 [Xiphophorus hellerii]|uniref:uncharacterized protein LOC116733898 isoform X5 n=1 Tax=Xiphophorus hellerii TaxID=8084 RepID=UPI0013B3F68A|nr:uncharacterized protein LOC116733898 isoform X5 [Xiphophorus hellerii]